MTPEAKAVFAFFKELDVPMGTFGTVEQQDSVCEQIATRVIQSWTMRLVAGEHQAPAHPIPCLPPEKIWDGTTWGQLRGAAAILGADVRLVLADRELSK